MDNNYIHNREGYLNSLLELFEYCNANNLPCSRIDQDGDDYVFSVKINKDAVLEVYTVVENVHDIDLVRIHLIPNTVHSKYVGKKLKVIQGVGGLGLGGYAAIGAFLVPGIGLGLGLLVTGVSYVIGCIPGFALNKTDEVISKNIMKACEVHISKLTLLFDSYLLNFDKITNKVNSKHKDEWISKYIERNNLKLYSFKIKVRSGLKTIDKTVQCNSLTNNKKGVTIYNTFDKRDIGQEIKGKLIEDSLMINKEVKNKAFYAYIDSEILPNYDKNSKKNTIDSDKIRELETALANKCKY